MIRLPVLSQVPLREVGHLVEHRNGIAMVVDHLVFSHPLQCRYFVVFLRSATACPVKGPILLVMVASFWWR
jgi:hypothetical protein